MLVKPEFLADKNHGTLSCTECHGGDPKAETRKAAHKDLVTDPSFGPNEKCSKCHQQTAKDVAASLHVTLEGEKQSMIVRSGGTTLGADLTKAFNNHCGRCHSSCGNCHISVPNSAGGGLLDGHVFTKTPPMNKTCTACHGSRVSDEYKGDNAGIKGDVHYSKAMQCTSCHSGDEMHGKGQAGVKHRYAVTNAPRCTDCHADNADFKKTMAHKMHRDANDKLTLSCYVCHAQPYKNCNSCHVSLDKDNHAVFEVNAPDHKSIMTFKIGKNPLQDALHPEKWVVLRHVPVDPNNYDYYGAGLLTTFDAAPTWRLATPHNIQRITPQNKSCTLTCHGKRDLYLGPNDLLPYEVNANSSVVVSDQELP